MSSPIRDAFRVVLLDIEGTTTPLDFVYRTLFPFARTHVKKFLARRRLSGEVQTDIARLLVEHGTDRRRGLDPPELRYTTHQARLESLVTYIHWLMDRDRKSIPLKSLQGKIWEEGYRRAELRGEVFPDVPLALQRWRRQKKKVGIFSSGSVLAQKLLFAHTTAGDLSGYIQWYFDTSIGPKADPESYGLIAATFERQPSEIVFISDVTAELDAAQSAGMQTLLSVRPGNRPQPDQTQHPIIYTLDEVP